MQKDFKHWHSKKIRIDSIPERPFFHEGEIWYCHLGANVGSEQDGVGDDFLRPIVIVRKFNDEVFWGVPLTRTQKKSPYYFAFAFGGEISVAILSQIRLIDARRLSYLIGVALPVDFSKIRKQLRDLIP